MSNTEKLTKRQQFILQIIEAKGSSSTKEILGKVADNFDKSSRITVIRDLNILLNQGVIKKYGKGRNVHYQASIPVLVSISTWGQFVPMYFPSSSSLLRNFFK